MRHGHHNRRRLHLDLAELPDQIVAVRWEKPSSLTTSGGIRSRSGISGMNPIPQRRPWRLKKYLVVIGMPQNGSYARPVAHERSAASVAWGNLALNSESESPQRNPFHPSASSCPVGDGVAGLPDPRLRFHKGITRPPRLRPARLLPVGGASLVGSVTGGNRGDGVDGCCPSSSANSARACGANSGCPDAAANAYAARAAPRSPCCARTMPSLTEAPGASSGCPESIANRNGSTASSNRPCMASAAPRLNAALGAASASPDSMARRHHTPASAPSPRCHTRLASANVDAA